MNTDDKIQAILRMEAESIDPSPAGWDAIQAGIAARRSRVWWTRGLAVAGAAAVFAGVALYVTTEGPNLGIDQSPTTHGPSNAESPAASPTVPPPVVDEPIGAIWPLTTTTEVAAWQDDHETYPALERADTSALAFARHYIGRADARVVALEGSYGENRFEARDPEGVVVSTLTVRGFGADGTAPFVVTRAAANDLQISSPAAGAAVSGRLVVRGVYEAAEPAFDVTLRADDGGSAPVELAKARATTGPQGWSATLTFTTRARTGSLLVTNGSLRDGGVGSAAAIPLVFGTAPPAVGPAQYVAARDGRIALLSTATGELVRWLTDAEPGGGAYDPELSADGKSVVYVQAAGTCSSQVRSVPVTGGEPEVLVGGDEGAIFSPSRRGDVLAFVRTLCQDGGSKQEVVVRGGATAVAPVAGTVTGGPVVGERSVAFVVSTTRARTLHTIDLLDEQVGNPAPEPEGCSWLAPAWGPEDANGREQLFVAASCSPADEVVETRLYRFDADAGNRTLLATLDLRGGVESLDYAGDALIVGARDVRDPDTPIAYTYVGGTLRRVPGSAQRPTWAEN